MEPEDDTVAPKPRPTVRVVLLSPEREVLLVRFHDGPRSWWCTPGGGIEPGETDAETASRELDEELGLKGLILGPWVWSRHWSGTFQGRPVSGDERIYLAWAARFEPHPPDHRPREHGPDDIRWWTLGELETTSELLVPRDLAVHLRDLIEGGAPTRPIELGA